MLVYNCIVVDVGSCYVRLDSGSDSSSYSSVIMVVHELIRRTVLVTYWLLNLIDAN